MDLDGKAVLVTGGTMGPALPGVDGRFFEAGRLRCRAHYR